MSRHLSIKKPWSQLGALLGIFCMMFILSGAVSMIIYAVGGIKSADFNNVHFVNVAKVIQAISSILLFIVPPFLFARFSFTGNYGYFLGFRNAEKSNMYMLAILGIILAMPFVIWLGHLNEMIPLPENLTKMEEETVKQLMAILKVRSVWDIVINVFVIALLPAIGEELFFRGALQRIVIQLTRNPWVGIILTAVLFSALHFQFSGFLPRMFLGIVLGAFYWFSGSIYTSMIAHFANNAVQVIAASYAPKFVEKNPQTPVLAAMASGIVVWAILWYFQKQSTVTYSKVYETDELTSTNQFIA
ncbi:MULTISPECIES: CPBP family intramembrane glutamic endopeptidase [Niastella]|uniref:CPBP family intramembrane metalloprotease n=1 Tax=Niastella soli TaxID=2821487 RepID=A0ABS3YQC4_9BACT|nr:CPBP family intramembrane glutamic endopeptidase [Niastella soli]MBO9200008.1 CPBP family intramembrane metalloprotease [Niastella soli]